MSSDHRARLANIKRFDQLVAYLRDEMGWPIESGSDFEELTFEYAPEELGIDSNTAAKIQEIRRLRPLSLNQPWGIFFVKFEPRRLPVVALRRILGRVALKKRASANSAERAAWEADDLLFISNYGEGDERQISFAHFSRPQDGKDLPTLKVLGWDNRDTALHLDAVARELGEHLSWPEDEEDAEAWRDRWRSAFSLRHREAISTSRDLSIRLAALARDIRDRIATALVIETDQGPLTRLLSAFKVALVHDLDAEGFADMYAQTIAYGLLSARVADPHKKTADDFAAHMRTNPFLRELMETFLAIGGRNGKAGGAGLDFDELGVSEVVGLLDDAKMEAVIRDFGDRNPQEDPVIHFYELFLKEYDAKKRMQRGVFYTPRPVVAFIVRSVDDCLRRDYGLEDGLAATTTWEELAERGDGFQVPEGVEAKSAFVQILDPATGTGTFLVEAIDVIHKSMVSKWLAAGKSGNEVEQLWNAYVPQHLLPRLHGFELMMAPYAIAHMKVGLKLHETGYRFEHETRLRVYLANALEPAHDYSGTLEFAVPALAHEAESVAAVKRDQRFTVVIGNPPYAGISSNMGEWIDGLLKGRIGEAGCVRNYYSVDGKPLGERKLWLQDDYVKFLRLAQLYIDMSGCGIVGMITNHGYIDNPTFRGMRQSLLDTFPDISVVDLHGNIKRKQKGKDGERDENVFDITQGVAISLLSRLADGAVGRCQHASVVGPRLAKYRFLSEREVSAVPFVECKPTPSGYYLFPQSVSRTAEWEAAFGLADVFLESGVGVVTARDGLTTDFSRDALWDRVCPV